MPKSRRSRSRAFTASVLSSNGSVEHQQKYAPIITAACVRAELCFLRTLRSSVCFKHSQGFNQAFKWGTKLDFRPICNVFSSSLSIVITTSQIYLTNPLFLLFPCVFRNVPLSLCVCVCVCMCVCVCVWVCVCF